MGVGEESFTDGSLTHSGLANTGRGEESEICPLMVLRSWGTYGPESESLSSLFAKVVAHLWTKNRKSGRMASKHAKTRPMLTSRRVHILGNTLVTVLSISLSLLTRWGYDGFSNTYTLHQSQQFVVGTYSVRC